MYVCNFDNGCIQTHMYMLKNGDTITSYVGVYKGFYVLRKNLDSMPNKRRSGSLTYLVVPPCYYLEVTSFSPKYLSTISGYKASISS